MKLAPKQKHYFKYSTAKINVSHGAVRSGKTFITNHRWLKYVDKGPEGTLMMSGRTMQSLEKNVLKDIFDFVGKHNYRWRESKGELTLFGREIECFGADKADSEARIRGRTFAGWYGDEITIQHKKFVQQAITRNSVPGAQSFWTTNPDHPDHYIRKDFITNPEMLATGQIRNWHFYLEDNKTLTADYIQLLKNSFSGVFYERNIDGLWVIAKGVVYSKDYKPEIHRVSGEEIARMRAEGKFLEYVGGIDWGYTHPMVGLICGVTADYKYYQVAEFYQKEKRTEDLGQWFLQWETLLDKQLQVIYCDSAEPDRIVTLKAMGLRVKGADKAINAGINSVMTCFKTNRLHINDICPNTHEELGKYRYPDPDDITNPKDVPLDLDNHAMDALRYMIHNYEKYLTKLFEKMKRNPLREKLTMI